MASTVAGRAKRVRTWQRAVHLTLGIVLVSSIYVPAEPGTVFRAIVEYAVAPGVVLVGVLMWQWPTIRRLLRGRGSGRPGGGATPVVVGDNVA